MKASLSLIFVFCIFSFGRIYAQDTTSPAIMSQHAYDSTLRALKKAAQVKQKDTVKSISDISKDTSGGAKNAVKQADTSLNKKRIPESTIKQIDSIAKPVPGIYEADTAKKKKIKYIPTGYLELSYGEAFPAGDFALSAYPNKGGMVSFTAAFPGIVSHFGFIFKIGYGFNHLNKVRYMDSLKSQANNTNLGYTMNDTTLTYTNKTAMLGLFYTYTIKKITIDARFLCGIMVATIPGTNVNIIDYSNQNNLVIHTYKVSGSAFAVDEGISVRYQILKQFSVSLGIDNLSASPSFVTVGNTIAPNLYGVETQMRPQTSTIIQPFHVFCVNLGACYIISATKKHK